MDSPTQPTFIPHESAVSSSARAGGLGELATLVSILLFIISAALGAGVFLYTQYLQSSNASKLQQLQSVQASFDPALIQQLTRLDDRMNAAETLLSAHLAPTQFFTMLEQSTVQDISFTALTYDSTNPSQITLSMDGIAGSVNSIALQAQVFSQSGIITDPIFSNIDAQPEGVHFHFSANINPSAISYKTFVAAAQPQTVTPLPAQVQSQTPPTVFESTSTGATPQQ